MKKILTITILMFLGLIGCPNHPPQTNNECFNAEQHLKFLGCIATDKPYTVKGKSFQEFCEDTLKGGIDLHPGCLSHIAFCNQINSCVQAK